MTVVAGGGLRWAVVLLLGLLSACAVTPSRPPVPIEPKDRAPRAELDVLERLVRLPDPEVRNEPRSKWGNGPVYSVLGKSYRVMDSARNYRQEGLASWYGTKFHGRRTSNGERFDVYQLTAAHRHLPLPSFVRVTNLQNGRHTVVRVNDRGPFHSDRIIDLSYAAAVKLGFHTHGTARVRIEVLEPEPEVSSYMVQAGAFSQLTRADRSHQELAVLTGMTGVVIKTPGDGLFKVQFGPVRAGEELQRLRAILEASDYGAPRLIPLQ